MGRKYIIKREPVTSLSAYVVDSMLIDDFQQSGESKSDALRRIFINFFGEDVVKAKKEEIRKKLDRQAVLHNRRGDQGVLDNTYYPKREFKDIVYDARELVDIIIEARGTKKDPLAKRNALDSIQKACNHNECKPTIDGKYQIIRKWF